MEKKKVSVRPLAWHDYLTFYRYRQQLVCTDSAQALTRGSPIGPMAILARLNLAVENYSCISPSSDGNKPLIGHIQYTSGDRSARLVYLMPEDSLGQPELLGILDHMASQAGAWGAYHLLAEVEENSCAIEGLRRTGFSVYAWQQIWKFCADVQNTTSNDGFSGEAVVRQTLVRSSRNGLGMGGGQQKDAGRGKKFVGWRPATSIDENAVRNLFQALVPPLVQSAEPLTSRRLSGWTYRQEDEILAYVEGTYGPQGIYLQPLIHPALENVGDVLTDLLRQQPNRAGRPIYMAVRSYQAWLEAVLRDLECEIGPRQALMVKHLVLQQRAAVPAARHSVLEKYTAEPTVPLFHNTTASK